MKLTQHSLFLLVMTAAIFGCQTQVADPVTSPVAEQTTESEASGTAVDLADNAEEFVIDVRTQEEWDSGHLEQAVRIPHEDISERIAEVTEDKSAKIVLY